MTNSSAADPYRMHPLTLRFPPETERAFETEQLRGLVEHLQRSVFVTIPAAAVTARARRRSRIAPRNGRHDCQDVSPTPERRLPPPGTDPPLIQAAYRARIEQLRRRRQAETGTLPSDEEIEAALAAQRQARLEHGHVGHGHVGHGHVGHGHVGHGHVGHEHVGAHGGQGARREPDARSSGGMARTLHAHLDWLREAG